MLNMKNKNETESCKNCCNVEAVVSFDDRGQLVIPKDVRKKFKLEPGEKFALISCTSGDELCCFTLVKTSSMQGIVQEVLSPVFKNMG
jgi:AbrB family looped-hinge helix DNA binding protein